MTEPGAGVVDLLRMQLASSMPDPCGAGEVERRRVSKGAPFGHRIGFKTRSAFVNISDVPI